MVTGITIRERVFSSKKNILFLIIILIISFISKVWNISAPDSHYFDEIYYGFTAEQYAQGNIKAWVWDYSPPEGYAYTWDHPPTGKLIMAGFVKLFGVSSTSRRLAPLLAGTFLPLVVYLLAKTVFPDRTHLPLIAAFLTACEGLVLSLSRIALTDSILTLFICLTILFLWKKNYLISAIFFGLAVSTKWTGVYLLPVIWLSILFSHSALQKKWVYAFKNSVVISLLYLVIGAVIYIVSYTPLFVNYGGQKFIDLHKQMWWYHTNLKATHPSQSAAYLWPINYRPVWFWVDYQTDTTGNIYAMLNPIIAWGGILAVIMTAYVAYVRKSKSLLLLVSAYLIFWVPWIFSPRIMFLYHYLPSVPFLIICTAFILDLLIASDNPAKMYFAYLYMSFVLLSFIFFYPYWTGIQVENDLIDRFRWFKTWGP